MRMAQWNVKILSRLEARKASVAHRMHEESVDGNISNPRDDSAECSTEMNSKRTCHTRSRMLAVDVEELIKAISINPTPAQHISHLRCQNTDYE
jgi:hypothetical protein